jgi:predicted PurR-regulated permease PerM
LTGGIVTALIGALLISKSIVTSVKLQEGAPEFNRRVIYDTKPSLEWIPRTVSNISHELHNGQVLTLQTEAAGWIGWLILAIIVGTYLSLTVVFALLARKRRMPQRLRDVMVTPASERSPLPSQMDDDAERSARPR